MSILNPTMDYAEDGFKSLDQLKVELKKILDSKPPESAPHTKNHLTGRVYGPNGKCHWGIRRVSYTGKHSLNEIEGHEADSTWEAGVTAERHIGLAPMDRVPQADFAQARR